MLVANFRLEYCAKGLNPKHAVKDLQAGNQQLKEGERRPAEATSLRSLQNSGNHFHKRPHGILFGSTNKKASRRSGLIRPAGRHGNSRKRRNCQRNPLNLLKIRIMTCHDRLLKSVSPLYLYVEQGGAKTTSAYIFF